VSAPDVATLPPEVARALRDAFGDEPVSDLAVLAGGRSGAILLSLTVAGRSYVLRRPNPGRPFHDVRTAREIACLTIASDRGVAPRLHHVDAAAGVTIMDRIPVDASAPRPRGPEHIERATRTLRRLHEGPAFPAGASATFMVRHLDETLRARQQGGLPAALLDTMTELADVTARFAESAPCHNDLNPGNILATQDAVYFVDWETAGNADPFLDLAQLGVFTFPAPDERAQLLEAYLGGRAADVEERARATVARVMALGFYASAFVLTAAASGAPVRLAAALPVHEMLVLLGTARERASPEVVAASLLEAMRRESETAAYAEAKRFLARG
jgi:aminoglycoside phosphotransferase (APT) family kinase protein